MNKKLLIAPNSFKEVADSDRVADLFCDYLKQDSGLNIEVLPISDGGDGFLNACKAAFGLEVLNYDITTPYDDSTFSCETGYDRQGKKIYIESARVLGLRVIPENKRNPLKLSSKGIGDLFLKILDDINQNKISVNEVIIGVGGTGTNDLGLGVCSRFGLELYDIFGKKDQIIPEYYYRIKDLKWDAPDLPFKLKVVIDVNNPLLGGKGAARTFGPQKGADKGEVEVLELGFTKIVNLLKDKDIDRSFEKLSGAGGGLAAGLYLFFNAASIEAKDYIRNELRLEEKIKDKDVILTGEGSFDDQTLNGKGAGIVLNLAMEMNKRVILCCGNVDKAVKERIWDHVDVIELSSFFGSKEESINNFEKGIEMASRKAASLL